MEKKKTRNRIITVLVCAALLAGSFGGGFLAGRLTVPESVPAAGESASEKQQPSEETTTARTDGTQPSEETVYGDDEYVESMLLAGQVLDRYKDAQSPYGYTYGTPIAGIGRSDGISIKLSFDVEKLDVEYWTELFALYEDPQLSHRIGNNWDYDKESGIVTLSPSNYPAGLIRVGTLDTVTAGKYTHDDTQLFPHDAGTDWGNLGTMYLASYVDIETGEWLDTPMVQVVTVLGELQDTPRLTYMYTEDGRVHFTWTEVEGAEQYFVCKLTFREDSGSDTFLNVIGITEDATDWSSEAPEYGSVTANYSFRNYSVAEDDWYNDACRESRIAEYGEEPVNVWDTDTRYRYYVIAVSGEGSSMMSNPVDILDIQENIPIGVAFNTWGKNGYHSGKYDTLESISPYGYVTMADGSTAMKLIDYDTEHAVVVEDRYIYTDEDGNYVEGKNVNVLKVPYRIEGTPFEDVACLEDYDESHLEEDLRFLEEREDLLRKKAGDVVLRNDITFAKEEIAPIKIKRIDIPVTANSALSEYLAMNMLAGTSVIDVSQFPEAADSDMLADALLEAYYQNPLILGIEGYRINRAGTAVKVVYEETAESLSEKQNEIKQAVLQVTRNLITDDMTDLEKEFAINQYLCDTCEYDDDALENAESNDFRYVDSEFRDSFTAYGALLNGRCVCAGYAAAFKLLADAAGLDSVVVTGTLEGTLPHAWNKVRIDGEWEILDVTNNDNEFLQNALLNLPDEAGRRTLTEDADYALDGCLRNYAANNGQKEFYRLNGMYYTYDRIAEKLAEQLEENGTARLRTEYALDDEIFNRIGREVYDYLTDEDAELYGYYWMGVIYLEKE